jgi:putative DNA primase/helicase
MAFYTNPNDTRRAAERYLRAGLAAIPVPAGEKNPNRRGWQQERWTIADIPQCWSNGQNIGLLTGEPSGWLVDVDLDCPEAVKIAGRFLDPTRTSGRESTPDAHWWYRVEDIRSTTFEDLGGPDAETILEIRSNGRQTVVAPSLHPSGERYTWSGSGLEFASIGAESLLRACRELATAALVGRVLPSGGRHRFGLALAGFLLRRGLEPEDVERIMHAAWDVAGFDSERAKREAHNDIADIVEDTAEGLEAGTEISGGPTLDALRPGLPRKISRFWGWNGRDPDQPPRFATTEEPGRFNLTDLGNAERLAYRHGRDLRYVHPWSKWLAWDGKRWAVDAAGEVERRAVDTVRSIYAEAASAADFEERKRISRHAESSEARSRIEAMIALARSMPGIPVTPGQLDRDPWLLNVENGTVELRTGALRQHRREDLLTKLAPVKYRPDAEAPTFQAFLERILPSEALRWFLRRAVGYSASGEVSEEALMILHGTGDNGKTTLVNAVLDALGDYAMEAPPDLILAKRGSHPTELADLFGARFVSATETDEGRRLAESLVKQLTGRDRIKARRMREDFWQFDPTHTIFLATNHKPEVRGTDHAIWRRIKLVPFEVKIPEAEKDRVLPRKLRTEMPGILAWIVRGCLDYQREGLGVPEEVRDATEGYRSEMDVLAAFLEERCVVNQRASAGASALYGAYKEWCADAGEAAISQRKFGRQLGERGFVKDKSGTIIWHGIGLRFDRPDPDHSPPKGPRSGPSESKGPDGEFPVYKRESAESADRSGPSGPGIDIKNQI